MGAFRWTGGPSGWSGEGEVILWCLNNKKEPAMLKIRQKVPAEKTWSAKTTRAWLDNQRDWGVFRQHHPRSEQLATPVTCLLIVLWVSSVWMGWVDFLLTRRKGCSFSHLVMQLAQRSQTALLTVVTIGSPAQKPSSSRGGMVSLHRAPCSIPEVTAEDFLRPLLEAAAVSHYFAQGKSQGQFIFMGWKSRLNLLRGEAHHRKIRLCVASYMKQRS